MAKNSKAKAAINNEQLENNKEPTADENAILGENADNVSDNDTDNYTDTVETKDEACNPDATESEMFAERDKYLRLAAEYDNFRKRSAKEREMIYSNARIDAISKLLPVYDNLERALKMECSDEAYYKGVEMIMTQLTDVLNDMGVSVISALGETFDPNLHNAVMKIEDPVLGENVIADEFQKGFTLGERVIRFSTVVVAN